MTVLREEKTQTKVTVGLRTYARAHPVKFFKEILLPLIKVAVPREVSHEHGGHLTVSAELTAAFGRIGSLSDSELDQLIREGAKVALQCGAGEDSQGQAG